MIDLYKECELRRFGHGKNTMAGTVERTTRWLPASDAVIGRLVQLGERGEWEIISAPDPALPENVVRRFDPDGIAPRDANWTR